MSAHRVVIVGGGFGGLYAAQALRRAPVEVTLVDRRNFHLFQPLLYQVATAGLSPGDIASPLRAVLSRQSNTRVLLGEVTGFDVGGQRGILSDGHLPYDTLVVAAGARHHYFALHSPAVSRGVREPAARPDSVGDQLRDLEPGGPPHHRPQSVATEVGGPPRGGAGWGALQRLLQEAVHISTRRIGHLSPIAPFPRYCCSMRTESIA